MKGLLVHLGAPYSEEYCSSPPELEALNFGCIGSNDLNCDASSCTTAEVLPG